MNNIIKFNTAIDKITEVAPLLIEDARKELKEKSDIFLQELQESRYIKVPLVGTFSAGKSSLLNVFTQKPGMLPVDTLPETAVAYELYYGETECIDLFRNGNKIDTKPLSDIKLFDTKPGDIAKVYCKSEPIKKLQERGIILVDMPGIGSGIERHDAAIFNYINSGTAFILIVDAEQGSLRGNTLVFMNELSQYNMYPAVLVSKIDKKPEKDVKDIVEYIQYQMTKLGNTTPYISTVCAVNNNLEGLDKYLDQLDADKLVAEKFGKKLNVIIDSVINQIKLRIDLRSRDIVNIEEKIKDIDKEITNVKTELPSKNNNTETPEKSTDDILENVKLALEAKATDIAQMIIDKEDQETIKSKILSIVRTEIISSIKEENEQYSAALNETIQESIEKLSTIDIDSDFIDDYSEIISLVCDYINNLFYGKGNIATIINIVLPFIPNVINWLFGKSQEEILEEVRNKVIDVCANQITTGLKPTMLKIITENQNNIQKKMQDELVSRMEKMKDALREKMADTNKSKEEVQNEISKLNAAIIHLNSVKESLQI